MCAAMIAAMVILLPVATEAYDRTEAEGCASCHSGPNPEMQVYVMETWLESSHGNAFTPGSNDNTYCAKCHSPFEADPAATHSNHDPVDIETAQAITCSACHPEHGDRVEWGTPIGNYDVAAGAHFPVYDAEELCEYCHSGSRHAVYRVPDMEGVECVDCHMPKMPVTYATDAEPPGVDVRMTRNHMFNFPEDDDALAERADFSCGSNGVGCHSEESTDWAVGVIRSGWIHRAPPPGDTWAVQIPFLGSEFWVTFEEFGGFLLVETSYPDGSPGGISLGMEFGSVIFWMNTDGTIFFGNINHDTGTAAGIVFFYDGSGSSVWFAEKAE